MSDEKINYLEIPSTDLMKTKTFFQQVFDWQFTDYGDEYTAFSNSAGMDGGFYLSKQSAHTAQGSVLIVLFSQDLDKTQRKIEKHGGVISTETFEFPGGKRFHFLDPTGNEFGVWSNLTNHK